MSLTSKPSEIDKNQLIEAVARLIELTQQRKIVWERTPSGQIPGKTEAWVVTAAFDATYKGRRLRILRISFKPQGGTNWIASTSLQFVNDSGGVIWNFPVSAALHDLATAVEYQVAGVHEFLDSLLNED